ncbi:MAG TPA: hypothetical protein VKA65_06380 [Acidimicrobiales bacterium]|nr:hypothetical protein [Acidimicrobiales bacterium]
MSPPGRLGGGAGSEGTVAEVVVGDGDVHEAMTAWSHVRPEHHAL